MVLYMNSEQAFGHPDGVTWDELSEMADEFVVTEDHTVVVTHYRETKYEDPNGVY